MKIVPVTGWYYEPTIADCPHQSMRIVDTELFDPVLSMLRFRDEEEVVALANDTRHGLAAGIFTRDSARSLRVARAVRAGIVWVNTYRAVSPIAEFGGFKGSGHGRESGFQAIYELHPGSTPTTHIASTMAPQRSGSRSTSKACINPARPCRPCKRPSYAAMLRAQRRDLFPLPPLLGPTQRCFQR